jgi:catecholate siderophore receptor
MLVLPRLVAAESLSRSLLGGTALGLLSMLTPAVAQTSGGTPTVLPSISVETGRAGEGGSYRPEASTLPKLTEPLKDTPQSITVVPRQMLDDTGATNFRDALRTVPGISLAAGEGGAQGDNLTIRGFNARGDIFLDGMRDFGSYYRDPFNYDSIEVLKGPSSILFGRGSTGGVVNQVSKTPGLAPFIAGTATLGTDLTRRATVDVNQPIQGLGTGAAVRLNAMIHDSEVAGRDVAENRRWGVAPSLALGLGTSTRFTLNYFHLSEDDQPDYGIPFLLSRPAPVNHSNYYGFDGENYLETRADVVTAKLEHDVNDALSLRTQFRYANYHRDVLISEAQVPASVTAATPLSSIIVNRNQISALSTETFLQNQTDATIRFNTGGIGHTLVTGIEIGRETSDPRRFTYTGVPGTSLLYPNPDDPFTGTKTVRSDSKATSNSFAVYALDTLKLGDQVDLIGGVRWDRFDTDFEQRAPTSSELSRVDEKPSWRAALVYKPLPNGSVYVSYGTSFNPSGESLSLSAANVDTPPEENEVYELGSKWDLFDGGLSVRGAIYHQVKTNARTPDPNDPLLNVVTGEQTVDGFEIEAAGRITKQWQVFSGYAFADSEVTKSNRPAEVGNPLANTPKHTFSLWTTYDLPYRIQVGAGAFYVASRVASSTVDAATGLLREVPDYWRFDAMAKYALTDNVDLQLNLYNLTDEFYFETIHPAHIIPGAGRTALLTTSFRF